MHTLLGILVVLHIICWAIALGAWAAAARTKQPVKGMAHAASGAVVLGLAAMMIGMPTGGGHLFYTLKLVFAVIAMVCAWMSIREDRRPNAVVWYLIPISIVANIVIGVFHIGA
ncbi:hypothetical protein [Brachybacterium nesterenkovii]|uniref:hypothetical protein n=1 Tax=Brachybacterium nesterenkovii TaxID=47847 RepID=UPI00321B05FA